METEGSWTGLNLWDNSGLKVMCSQKWICKIRLWNRKQEHLSWNILGKPCLSRKLPRRKREKTTRYRKKILKLYSFLWE